MKRREFLRTGVKTAVAAASVSVGGLSLVGCTTFDRLFSWSVKILRTKS
ncbi:MAG: hypothetical protein IPK04_14665 [Bdellovibrionales bacterium]|nr:hypothetical protein [Bdellovibrionales bacterium]